MAHLNHGASGGEIESTDQTIERVFAAVDSSPDGRASPALGVRIEQGNKCKLRALLLAERMPNVENVLLDMVRDARRDGRGVPRGCAYRT